MNAIVDEAPKIKRDKATGRILPGSGGKPKGAKSKIIRTLRECILLAGEQAGNKLEPGGGMVAYLRNIAETQPQLFTPLIGRVLPLDVTSSDGSMRPVVALYMPDNRRDTTARVIDVTPAPAIGHDTAADDTPAQPVPAEASAADVQSQTPIEPATHD